ncbi:DUF2827 family protein [Paraburkholderia kururiensis]|uniref:DUF2827 family protein n=1 Tax=Paraburkholderia kururiensis TaxID=984307 RepID=UPI0039A5EB35
MNGPCPRGLSIGITIGLRDAAESLWINGIKQNALYLSKLFQHSPLRHQVLLVNNWVSSSPGKPRSPWRNWCLTCRPGMPLRPSGGRRWQVQWPLARSSRGHRSRGVPCVAGQSRASPAHHRTGCGARVLPDCYWD